MKRAALVLIPVLLVVWLTVAILLEQRRAHLTASLVQAVNRSDAAQVESLLAQGADPNARDWKTYYPGSGTPFRTPWYEKYLAKLMRRSPRVDDPYVGPTVLIIAADHGDTAIVQNLLNDGADMMKTGTEVESQYGNRSTLSVIVPPLWEAVNQGRISNVALLIKRGAPVDGRGRGLTPLLLTDDLEIAAMLINGGADINAVSEQTDSEGAGETQLCRAISGKIGDEDYKKDQAFASMLLAKGAKVDAGDRFGRTPLMKACERGSLDHVRLLLKWGANVNARDQHGRSALSYSTQDSEILKLLYAHGADGIY